MAAMTFTWIAYCNRCDRGFTATALTVELAKKLAIAKMSEHAKKHDDYSPSLHNEIDD
jgi:hypothetical protein